MLMQLKSIMPKVKNQQSGFSKKLLNQSTQQTKSNAMVSVTKDNLTIPFAFGNNTSLTDVRRAFNCINIGYARSDSLNLVVSNSNGVLQPAQDWVFIVPPPPPLPSRPVTKSRVALFVIGIILITCSVFGAILQYWDAYYKLGRSIYAGCGIAYVPFLVTTTIDVLLDK